MDFIYMIKYMQENDINVDDNTNYYINIDDYWNTDSIENIINITKVFECHNGFWNKLREDNRINVMTSHIMKNNNEKTLASCITLNVTTTTIKIFTSEELIDSIVLILNEIFSYISCLKCEEKLYDYRIYSLLKCYSGLKWCIIRNILETCRYIANTYPTESTFPCKILLVESNSIDMSKISLEEKNIISNAFKKGTKTYIFKLLLYVVAELGKNISSNNQEMNINNIDDLKTYLKIPQVRFKFFMLDYIDYIINN